MDRDEWRRQKQEQKLARKAAQQHIPLDIALPIEGLSGPELEAQLRRRAELRIKQRSDFYKGLIAYIPVNVLVWLIWAIFTRGMFPWPIFVTVGMALGLASEAFHLYQDSAAAVGRREDRIQREIEIERMRLGLDAYDKAKRGQAMHLSDDGELVPDDESNANALSANR